MKIQIPNGYPRRLQNMVQITPNRTMPLEHFRLSINRIMGWNTIKSNDYQMTIVDDSFVFDGKGLGHNIGLCQCEAIDLANQQVPYKEIIKRYYQNIEIKRIDAIDVN